VGSLFAVGCGGTAPTTKSAPTPTQAKVTPPPPAEGLVTLAIADFELTKGKDEEKVIVIERKDFDGDVELEIIADEELKVDPKTVTVPKGQKEAKVKVSSDKPGDYKLSIKPKATGAKATAKDAKVTVKE
jgi:hypothetical protein